MYIYLLGCGCRRCWWKSDTLTGFFLCRLPSMNGSRMMLTVGQFWSAEIVKGMNGEIYSHTPPLTTGFSRKCWPLYRSLAHYVREIWSGISNKSILVQNSWAHLVPLVGASPPSSGGWATSEETNLTTTSTNVSSRHKFQPPRKKKKKDSRKVKKRHNLAHYCYTLWG